MALPSAERTAGDARPARASAPPARPTAVATRCSTAVCVAAPI